MGRSRWTVGGLMAAVLAAAIGFAALKAATETWALIIWSLALAMLAGALVRAWLSKGRGRASWAGAAVAGCGYASACLFMSVTGREDPSPITRRLDWLHEQVCEPRFETISLPRGNFDESFSAWSAAHPGEWGDVVHAAPIADDDAIDVVVITWRVATLGPFRRIGHGLLTILFAVAGGLLARSLYPRPGHRGPKEPGS